MNQNRSHKTTNYTSSKDIQNNTNNKNNKPPSLSEEVNFLNKDLVYTFDKSINDRDLYKHYVDDDKDDRVAIAYNDYDEHDTNTVADDFTQDDSRGEYFS